MIYSENPIFLILLLIAIVFIYYKATKAVLIKFAAILARRTTRWKNHTLQEKTGVLELAFIAFSHLVFCGLVIYCLPVSIQDLGLFNFNPVLIGYGVVLGIAEMSLSTLLCMIMIRVLQLSSPQKVPQTADAWVSLTRGGWIRHHLHTIKLLPWVAAFFIIFLQLLSEEIFFRGIIINVLKPYGYLLGSLVSIALFVYMQIFHMPSKITAMFPILGSLVMGVVHVSLYVVIPDLPPLIAAHFIFFISAIL